MIHSRPLFELTLQVPTITDLGPTPNGHRKIATVAGGRYELTARGDAQVKQ